MAERVRGPGEQLAFPQQLEADQFLHLLLQVRARSDRLEQRERKFPTENRCDLQQALQRLREPIDARGEQRLHAVREVAARSEAAGFPQVTAQLLDEERIALGAID